MLGDDASQTLSGEGEHVRAGHFRRIHTGEQRSLPTAALGQTRDTKGSVYPAAQNGNVSRMTIHRYAVHEGAVE